jgi:hypothetical protein
VDHNLGHKGSLRKCKKVEIGWGCGSSGRVLACQVQGPEFNLQYHTKIKKDEITLCILSDHNGIKLEFNSKNIFLFIKFKGTVSHFLVPGSSCVFSAVAKESTFLQIRIVNKLT